MRTKLYFIIALLIFSLGNWFTTPLSAQYILAGQTEGDNIYYFDIEDIYIYGHPNDPDGAYIDIDGGSWDLVFVAYYFLSGSESSTRTDITPFGNTVIATLDSIDTWVEKLEYGDTIHSGLNWYGNVAIFRHQTYDSSYGIFTGEGYMAFRITSPYELVGWFKLDVGDGDMLIKEYAFYSETYVGINDKFESQYDIKLNNPVSDILSLSVNSLHYSENIKYRIIDCHGDILFSGSLHFGKNKISMLNLPRGIYLMNISDQKGYFRSTKLLKI